jgi:hypothetical protein
MIITVELKQPATRVGIKLSIMATVGAAAYSVTVTGATARILFGMMKPGETGIDAFNRISSTYQVDGGWLPVAARPEEQITVGPAGQDFTFYDFVKAGDSWAAASAELANFLQGVATFKSGPALAPSALTMSAADMLSRTAKKAKTS